MTIPENIQAVIDKFVSNLSINILTTDAINGYGVQRTYYVKLTIADSYCTICGKYAKRCSVNEQVIPTNRACHAWIDKELVLGETSAETLEAALVKLSSLVQLELTL